MIREEGIVDTGVTRAMLNRTDPLTPCHVYSAIRVQRALVRKRRADKFKALQKLAVQEKRRRDATAGAEAGALLLVRTKLRLTASS